MFKKWRSAVFSTREHDPSDVQPATHSHELPVGGMKLSRTLKIVTIVLLTVVAAATAVGLVLLWPDADQVSEVAKRGGTAGQSAHYEQGEVLGIEDGCSAPGQGGSGPGSPQDTGNAGNADSSDNANVSARDRCVTMRIEVLSGPDTAKTIEIPVRGALASAGIQKGDNVEMASYPRTSGPQQGAPAVDESASKGYEVTAANYGVSGVFRGVPLALLCAVFVVVVIWVGRMRGLLSLVALGISAFLLLAFILPALVSGRPGVPVALVGASAIMFVILYLVHGLNMRTTAALIGTLFGILIMAAISMVAVYATRLSGIGDESSGFLSAVTTDIDFRGLLTCAIIIAGLGILNDVTITQSSAVWELRAAAPAMRRREVFARAMRIGRDHIASTVYTVFFAYVGAALSVLLVLYLFDSSVLSLLTREDIAVELVRTFCGSIGLILAVPITTWVATMFTPPGEEEQDERWNRDSTPADDAAIWID